MATPIRQDTSTNPLCRLEVQTEFEATVRRYLAQCGGTGRVVIEIDYKDHSAHFYRIGTQGTRRTL